MTEDSGRTGSTPVSSNRPIGKADLALLTLKRLTAALHTARLYGPRHPRTNEALALWAALLEQYLRSHGSLVLEVGRDSFALASGKTERADSQILPLVSALHGRQVRELTLLPNVAAPELQELLDILVLPAETLRRLGGAGSILQRRGVRHIALREVGAGQESAGDAASGAPSSAVTAILRGLVAATRNVRLYRDGHPIVGASLDELFAALTRALELAGSVRYEIRDGVVFGAGVPQDADALFVATFASDCVARQIGSLEFTRGLTRGELARTVSLLAKEPEELVVEGGFLEALRVGQITHVSPGGLTP